MADNDSNNKKGSNLGTAVVSAAIGAAVGAAAVALSDKENRKKIANKVDQLKKEGEKKLDEYQKKAGVYKEEGRQKIIEGLEAAKNKLETPKKEEIQK